MEMGNQEWNSGITKEMGNAEAFGRRALESSLKGLPKSSAYKYKEESFK
jgi:hypothetical protein